jgi:hypothetical protein
MIVWFSNCRGTTLEIGPIIFIFIFFKKINTNSFKINLFTLPIFIYLFCPHSPKIILPSLIDWLLAAGAKIIQLDCFMCDRFNEKKLKG